MFFKKISDFFAFSSVETAIFRRFPVFFLHTLSGVSYFSDGSGSLELAISAFAFLFSEYLEFTAFARNFIHTTPGVSMHVVCFLPLREGSRNIRWTRIV